MDSLRICWWIRDFIDIISVYFGQKEESSKTEGIHGKQPNLWFMDMIIINRAGGNDGNGNNNGNVQTIDDLNGQIPEGKK